MDRPATMTRADSTRRDTPTFQRPISRPASSRVYSGGGAPKPAARGAVKHRPVSYDYATGSTFAVKINGKPVFLLNDFRKKVDAGVKQSRYVTAFKTALSQQVEDKKKQDMIRDQYAKAIVPRFRPVEHTETGLTKQLLGVDKKDEGEEPPPIQGEIGYSRIDPIDPWENSAGGGLEKYNPCVTSVFAPVQFQGLDDTHPQWQKEPSSHLQLDFVYGYQGSSCWDQDLFGEGPGQDNIYFLQTYDPHKHVMVNTGEIVYFTAATVVIFDIKNNIQRYFHHSDDVTSMTVLKRIYQKPDASWEEMIKPRGNKAQEDWAKFFAFNKGVYVPNEKPWVPSSRLLPTTNEHFPQMYNGVPVDWRDWDLPNRCIVASGQKGRNPRIYVWRVTPYAGETEMRDQVLATMTLGPKKLLVANLSFNSQGNLLVALAGDMEHTITVFDWRKATKIAEGQGHGDNVDVCKFNPYSDASFASCGYKHLKFWEIGDGTEGFEMATGLFGDLGKPFNQRQIVFNPRGNTISGVENGDIYIWSSGTVSAKIERAHKQDVIGLLYVDGVGIFSAGRGGMLKMWDPELRDTKKPLCCIDLRSFDLDGDPKMIQRSAGRAMDWTTSTEMLQYVCDDNPVGDNPSRGIQGAPATHLSFKDLKADGILVVGTTSNSIILLGFRKVDGGEPWIRGLSGDTIIHGYDKYTKPGPLKAQEFWTHQSVEKIKITYKHEKLLPVATYWYQRHDEKAPGYRPKGAGAEQGSCPWKWAVTGKKICMRGHMSNVDGVAPMPNQRIFMTVSKDCTARMFDINDQTMIDYSMVHKAARSCSWWAKQTPEGVLGAEVSKEDGDSGSGFPVFAVGHEDGSFSVWRAEKSAEDAAAQDDSASKDPFFNPENAFGTISLCCSNPLPRKAPPAVAGRQPSEQVFAIKYSPDGRYLAVCLGDNCIDLYKHQIVFFHERPERDEQREKSKQKALGFTDEEIERQMTFPYKRVGCCNDHSSAVTHVDFDIESQYIRSTSQSNELLYAFVPHGKQSTATQELSRKQWSTDTCVLGWTVKSIWAKGSTGSDINTLDRTKGKVPPWAPCHGGAEPAPYPYPEGYTPLGSTEPADIYETNNYPGEGRPSSHGHHVIATGEDCGLVKLFRWPTFGFKQAFRTFIGHGSQVAQVRFTYDDDYLISCGGLDMSIFQWRHVIPNKIYVQNLPDKTVNGKFKLSNSDLKGCLIEFFSKLFKFDRRNLKLQRNKAGQLVNDEIDKLEQLQKGSFSEGKEGDQYKMPDRKVVSVEIFNSGAKHNGMPYPATQSGCKVTDRWATVTFYSKEDADDVLDLYGCMKDVMGNLPAFDQNRLHLYPLYRCEVPDDEEETQQDYNRTEPVVIVRKTDERDPITGKNKQQRWIPCGTDDYEDKSNNPHFLLVSAADPNENLIRPVLHRAMKQLQERMKAEEIANEAEGRTEEEDIKVLRTYREEALVWKQIQLWDQADDHYGGGSDTTFPNFDLWAKNQEGSKGKSIH